MRMTSTSFPDLSLQISPPTVSDCNEVGFEGLGVTRKSSLYSAERSSTTDSGSSGSDLSHENGYFNQEMSYSTKLGHNETNLSLGFDHSVPLNVRNQNHHHQYHPHVYGREFKRSARMIGGVKRSVRAPRMRWTTTLHAHFVHAVQLLGGHESNTSKPTTLVESQLLKLISCFYYFLV